MTLTIDWPQPLEQQFRQEADSKGLNLDSYLVLLLNQMAEQNKPKRFTESDLLKRINTGVSQEEWATYKKLNALRREELLTEQAHQTLIQLGDKIEQANVLRVQNLIALAQLREVLVQKLIQDLGIKPVEVWNKASKKVVQKRAQFWLKNGKILRGCSFPQIQKDECVWGQPCF